MRPFSADHGLLVELLFSGVKRSTRFSVLGGVVRGMKSKLEHEIGLIQSLLVLQYMA